MKDLCKVFAASAALLFCSFTFNLSAFADVQQVLETVAITDTNSSAVSTDSDFEQQFGGNVNLTDCVAGPSGTLCLENRERIIRLIGFPNGVDDDGDAVADNDEELFEALFTCTDLGFEPARNGRPGNCTAIAASPVAVFVAGIIKRRGSAIAIAADFTNDGIDNDLDGFTDEEDTNGECDTGYTQVAGTDFCSGVLAQDRPPIVEVDWLAINELRVIEDNNGLSSYTGLEPEGTATGTTVSPFADLKGLLDKGKVKELAQHLTAFKYMNGEVEVTDFVVTTSFGDLIILDSNGNFVDELSLVDLVNNMGSDGIDNDGDGMVDESDSDEIDNDLDGFIDEEDEADEVLNPVASCSAEASYDVTQSGSGSPLVAAVSSTCYVHVLNPVFGSALSGFQLGPSVATTIDSLGSDGIDNDGDGLVDGDDDDEGVYNPFTVTAFEGQNVNFGACGGEPCPVGTAALLSFNHVEGTAETGSAWELHNIPHCAWIPDLCIAPLEESRPAACVGKDPQACMCDEGVLRVVGPLFGGAPTPTPAECAAADPGLLDFNPVPILPTNLIAEFDEFPTAIWMPPFFEAQEILNRHFDALLIDPGDGQSGEPAELVVDASGEFGAYGCPESGPDSPLQSSVVLRMREGPRTGGTCSTSPTGVRSCELDERMGSMITYDCVNPTTSRGCCSLFPLDVMLARRPPAVLTDSTTTELRWYLDPEGLISFPSDPDIEDDSAAAKFIRWHFENLEVFEWAACNDVDGDPNTPPLAPLNVTTCDQLAHIRNLAREKLSGAFENTATSGELNNCSQASRLYSSFNSQINNYVTLAGFREDTFPLCNDGIDNDDDGLVDGDDPDCAPPIPRDRAGRIEALVAHGSALPYAVDRILLPTIPRVCETGWLEFNNEWWQNLASP